MVSQRLDFLLSRESLRPLHQSAREASFARPLLALRETFGEAREGGEAQPKVSLRARTAISNTFGFAKRAKRHL